MRAATRFAAAVLLSLPLLAACTAGPQPTTAPPTRSAAADTPVLDEARVADGLAALPQRDGLDLKPTRLADGLVPPTNRWFSGLVFGDKVLPVFPLPLSFSATADGIEFGVPVVNTTAKTIMGGHHPVVRVSGGGTPSWQVSAYDEMSVTLTDAASGNRVQIAQGSPYVHLTVADATELKTDGLVWQGDGSHWTVTAAGTTYGVTGDGVSVDGSDITVPAGATVSWFAVPTDGDAARLAELAAPLTSTSASYEVGTDAATTLTYATEGGRPTAFAAMPHHLDGMAADACTLGTYPSIFGTLNVCEGTTLTWRTPTYQARAGLDLSVLSQAEKSELADQLALDVAADPAYPADTYFGGKALYRDAQLWQIATQLGATDEADALRERLTESLAWWMDPKRCETNDAFCFVHDTTNRGVVGRTPSFGSDEFNDHHFHYGYFLYAAGVLAADDPALAERWAPVMDLLAADIAMAPASDLLPMRRNFDAYASHSWASGTSPFADGNNQESSSEAVNAWAGLTLWAQARDNAPLEAQARWMHALEAQAARAYWTDFDASDPVYAGYGHSIVPLIFGGKRDYATWFSAEPAAHLAILVIPASPSSDHLAGDPDRIRANVAEATATRGYAQQYGDYLLMYEALAGPEDAAKALEVARTLPDEAIDDGSTRTYLLAHLMAHAG
ncbi:MAG: glycosyl hydrolase [Actinomycetes bacterium]